MIQEQEGQLSSTLQIQFDQLSTLPQSILPKEKEIRIEVSLPLGEGFRVRGGLVGT